MQRYRQREPELSGLTLVLVMVVFVLGLLVCAEMDSDAQAALGYLPHHNGGGATGVW